MTGVLQQAWDGIPTLPPITFSETEEALLLTALAVAHPSGESQGWQRGMRDAANICGSLAETTYDDGDGFEAATGCEAAIISDLRNYQHNIANVAVVDGAVS